MAKAIGNPSTFYVQLSGGSAITTLLLGPVGILINSASIERKTETQAANTDTTGVLDPRTFAMDLAIDRPAGAENSPTVVLRPFLAYIRPKKSTKVERRLVFDIRCDGWHGWYTAHMSSIDASRLSEPMGPDEGAAFNAEIGASAKQLFALFEADANGAVEQPTNRLIGSWLLNPYFEAALPQGVRGSFEGRTVVVGQGDIEKDQPMLAFMKGVHILDADRLKLGKLY